MSEEQKRRTVAPPPARQASAPVPEVQSPAVQPSAGALMHRNQMQPPSAPVDAIDQAFQDLSNRTTALPQQPLAPQPAFQPSVEAAPEEEPVKVTFRVPKDVRDRFRAAFHYTAAIEGNQSLTDVFSEFLLKECERRERLYNGGAPFTGGQVPLIRGRRPNP